MRLTVCSNSKEENDSFICKIVLLCYVAVDLFLSRYGVTNKHVVTEMDCCFEAAQAPAYSEADFATVIRAIRHAASDLG